MCVCFDPQAFELLCDLLLLYSVNSVRSEPTLQSLVHLPSDSLRFELAAFLLDYIFTDSKDAELNGTSAPNDEKHPLLEMCINYGTFQRRLESVLTRVTAQLQIYSPFFLN